MIFEYFSENDMLYIKFIEGISVEAEEVTPGGVWDFDDQNRVIGIEIEDASTFIDLSHMDISALPIANLTLSKPMPVGV